MTFFRIVLLSIVSLSLIGCAPSTFEEMKSNNQRKQKTYIINKNYEDLYRYGLSKSRQCFENVNLLLGSYTVEGQIYANAKEAELIYSLVGGSFKSIIHGATFKEIDTNKTEIIIYTIWNETYIDKLKRSYTGETIDCDMR